MSEALKIFCSYIDDQMTEGKSFRHVTRHLLGVFNGLPGARSFRRIMTEGANDHQANSKLLTKAIEEVEKFKNFDVFKDGQLDKLVEKQWCNRFEPDNSFGTGQSAKKFTKILNEKKIWELNLQKTFFETSNH